MGICGYFEKRPPSGKRHSHIKGKDNRHLYSFSVPKTYHGGANITTNKLLSPFVNPVLQQADPSF